jgi:serine/threonine-protein kinase
VVHRDYKPENVLVAGDGTSKLTDFGLAARTGDRPFPSGTVSYMSPEQVAGGPASPASDVYAATATFNECLTGQPPFTGESAEVLRQHRYEPVPLEPVPSPLRPLVAAGMAKDPARRPADARAFVTELETVASGTYGPDWHRRGQSHLGEAALLLAALWPAGELAALQATTALQRIPLLRNLTRVKALRHLTPVKAAVAAAPIKAAVIAGAAVVAAGTAVTVAATVAHTTAPPSQLTPGVSGSPTPGQFPTQSGSPAPGGGNGPPTGTQTIPPTGGLLTTVPPTTGSPPSSAPSSNPPPSTPPPSTPPPSSPPPSTPPPSSPPPSTAPASAPPTFGLTLTIHHDGRGTAGRPRTIRLPAATAASTAITPQ